MGRASVKKDKNRFQLAREARGLTREKAAELFDAAGWQGLSPERIERIESGRIDSPHPYDVLAMSEVYGQPELCNYFCTQHCPVGEKYVREVRHAELAQITVALLDALNSLTARRDRLTSISADGTVDDAEITDFILIRRDLERVSSACDSLRLLTEQMLADGRIDLKKYNKLLSGEPPVA